MFGDTSYVFFGVAFMAAPFLFVKNARISVRIDMTPYMFFVVFSVYKSKTPVVKPKTGFFNFAKNPRTAF